MALDFPVIFLIRANLDAEGIAELETQIPTLTYDANEADVFLGKITQKKRALMELRKCGIDSEEDTLTASEGSSPSHRSKRRKISGSQDYATGSDSETASEGYSQEKFPPLPPTTKASAETFKVVKLAWFTESLQAGAVLPLREYLIYAGRKISSQGETSRPVSKGQDILKRAKADAESSQIASQKSTHGRRSFLAPAFLSQESTTEHEDATNLPPIPKCLHTKYACQRPALVNPPNKGFIDELKKIRVIRTLNGDHIGVRSYSTMIASLAAYPHTLSSAKEVARLPGCGPKSATLYRQFQETGRLKEGTDADADPQILTLKVFYEIYGVGESTAREFYNNGWRDMDDVVDQGWESLSRVQQIGVKYYDDFLLKIPRSEVESIAGTILKHARKLENRCEMTIVGGYRRGKQESGDVDVIMSHRDEAATHHMIDRMVQSLEDGGFIKHLLFHSNKNTERGQVPVSWKGNTRGSGFDTLDKALVVWQDPNWKTGETRNPNPHRRVDIIISPWKTVGCAVLGWTSGTTFQRDLRRYCKTERGLKFDSSGIRSRSDGSWVDLESGPDGEPAPDMLTAERRVFDGLCLEFRPPEERCTG